MDRVRRFTCGLGGSSANIAVGLARLGWRVCLAAALPDDAIGRFLRRRLAAEGIGLEAVQTVAGRTASLCLTQIAPPHGAEQVFYRCHPADAALRWSPAIAAALRASRGGVFLTNGTSLC
ncbi:MAG: PfkB family carbohydrate kinase, partial [Terriglobales bacterium]